MNNRFSHLKKKIEKNSLSLDEFIDDANSETNLTKKKRTSKKNVLLSATGQINRGKDKGKSILFYIKNDILSSIDTYCHGNKTVILNYLIQLGLEKIINENKLVLHIEDEPER